MADIERINAQQAHTKAESKQALLVCAYEDEAKCRMLNLDGSISFASLQSRAASLPKTQESFSIELDPAKRALSVRQRNTKRRALRT